MTNERARTELEQLYMSLSEEKKKALDVAFQAMEQAQQIKDIISSPVYIQEDVMRYKMICEVIKNG